MDLLTAPQLQNMFELVVRATILLSAALALAWLTRKGPARVRHLLWTMTFALLLIMPVISFMAPSWEVPVIPSVASVPPAVVSPDPAPVDRAAHRSFTPPAPAPMLPEAGPMRVPVRAPAPPKRSIPIPLLVWGVGCAAALASLAMSGLRFARLVRTATPLRDPARLRRVEAVRQRLGIPGDVRVVLNPAATTPMTGGLRRPVVLLPLSAMLWTQERWTVVLAHEMIHVRRRDVLRQLMVRVGLALYWFHPLSWVAAWLAATASEEACDEEVLAFGTRPSRYATHLLSLAGGMRAHRPVLSLPMAQRSHSQLERRIAAILNPDRPHPSSMAAAIVIMAIGAVGVSAAVADPVQTAQQDTVTAVVAARIGSGPLGDETEEYIFGEVQSVAADSDGRIYVADLLTPSVRVFGSDGEFVAWIGREGEGPGEFTWPVDILPAADGRLFVKGSRITTFAASASSEYPDSVTNTWRIPPYFNPSSFRARLVDGVYYYPHYTSIRDKPVDYFYMKYGPGGHTGDTTRVPAVGNLGRQFTAFYMVNAGSGRMVDGLNMVPFGPRADWDMTERGTIIASDGETYQIREFDQDGQLLRTITGPEMERRAVPSTERADSIRALEARIDSLPVPLEDVLHVAPEILRGEIPDSLPAVLSLHVGASDRIWVERWPSEGMGSSRYFDVLEYDGRYRATVVVPAPLLSDPPPFFGDNVIVGVVMDPTTEVHSVVALRFRLPR
ncbi:MAG: 6-bladed beta-propeller [Gemmatimonadetes bacterium]|nr:6-bladed beta-propeller [Gemmatimonadota bacterium]MYA42747.1 6-bladed beta-propeller [Gemmatimonadota bacterium]MYE95604.1 6-bladed beta-propeller [Gemmatimonadota bacterium]MYJ11344.1 6-bladed beta-propeller [Gemmatimonadota bacterium]